MYTRREILKTTGQALAGFALTRIQREQVLVNGKPVEISIASVSAVTVRISVVPVSTSIPDTGTIVAEARGKAVSGGRAGNLGVRVSTDPPAVHVDDARGNQLQTLRFDPSTPGMSFLLGKGRLLGLGEGGPQFDRKGQNFPYRSGQGGYQLATHGGRVPIQWLISTDGWAMFVHRPLGAFDLTSAEGKFVPVQEDLPFDLFVVGAGHPATIMKEYARITGFPEMPPRWTMGYQQSHRTLSGWESIKSVAETFREKKLPCDALIYLGTGFAPSGWNVQQSTTGFSQPNTEFTFHKANFPEPKANVDELHSLHFRVVLHIVIESENRKLTGSVADGCPNAEPGNLPVGCYWPRHKPVFDAGVDGWWPDQGDGFDEPSRRNRHRMYWEGSQLWRPNERPYALHRNGAAGMARYAAFLWSGDVQDRWETLKNHVPSGINSGLSGIPYWGTDIGGFIPTREFTGELYVRWFQFGAFCPLFRSHGRNWKLRLPWGWSLGTIGFPEVPNYNPDPQELHNPAIEPICKKYLELRYQLMPYLYSVVNETCKSGVPILRSLWFHDPGDSIAAARGDEYLWGPSILVAPVVKKAATSRSVYLPRGLWYDFWTQGKVQGAREILREVDLATMPLYVRAG